LIFNVAWEVFLVIITQVGYRKIYASGHYFWV